MAESGSDLVTDERAAAAASAPSDAQLVADTLAGDESAFEELFNRHRRRISFVGARFFGRREQIEEVVQETFTKAFFALKDFAGGREESFVAWLTRIAYNTCYDELRRAKRTPENSFADLSEDEAERLRENISSAEADVDVETSAIARDLAGKLLSRLKPEDRLVLVLQEVEGLSVADIARITEWSAAKVKVRAHRARLALRRLLKRYA